MIWTRTPDPDERAHGFDCPRRENPFRPQLPRIMKKFVPYLITAAVAILAVKVVYPMVQPVLAKVPLVGGFFQA